MVTHSYGDRTGVRYLSTFLKVISKVVTQKDVFVTLGIPLFVVLWNISPPRTSLFSKRSLVVHNYRTVSLSLTHCCWLTVFNFLPVTYSRCTTCLSRPSTPRSPCPQCWQPCLCWGRLSYGKASRYCMDMGWGESEEGRGKGDMFGEWIVSVGGCRLMYPACGWSEWPMFHSDIWCLLLSKATRIRQHWDCSVLLQGLTFKGCQGCIMPALLLTTLFCVSVISTMTSLSKSFSHCNGSVPNWQHARVQT